MFNEKEKNLKFLWTSGTYITDLIKNKKNENNLSKSGLSN